MFSPLGVKQAMRASDGTLTRSPVTRRWWKRQPAGRDVPQRQTSPRVPEEEDGGAGLGGSASEPHLQDASSTHQLSAPKRRSFFQEAERVQAPAPVSEVNSTCGWD